MRRSAATLLDIGPASSLSLGKRAQLFTAAYEGYVLPMHVDETALAWMQEKLDFDLDASRIAYRDGEPVGLANLAVRGRDAWSAASASSLRRGARESVRR